MTTRPETQAKEVAAPEGATGDGRPPTALADARESGRRRGNPLAAQKASFHSLVLVLALALVLAWCSSRDSIMFFPPSRSGNKRTSGHIQLIDRTGNFDVAGMERFSRENELAQCGLSYGIVAIMGPQSSGKSTLLNHLYDTDFKEMDTSGERQQTTQGIWLGKGVGIAPLMLVLDLEGLDGIERGQDVNFEKQSALLALAVSDIVLINMWYKDVGLEHAGSRPLLKTLLQERMQMTRLRRITLMFVLRDKPKVQSQVEALKRQLRKDVEKIWDTVHKPEQYMQSRLNEFFRVEIEALSHYEHKREEFDEEVVNLRLHLSKIIAPEGAFVPASGFSQFAQNVWEIIKTNRNLNLPTVEVLVARELSEETAKTTFDSFIKDEEWCKLSVDAKSYAIPDFGGKLTLLFERCLSRYDEKAKYFHEDGRRLGRESLTKELFKHVGPTVSSLLQNLHSEFLAKFKEAFDKAVNEEKVPDDAEKCTLHWIDSFGYRCADVKMEGANWDITVNKLNFRAEVEAHIKSKLKAKLHEALKEPVKAALGTADENTWPSIRTHFLRETALTSSISLLHDEDKNEIKSYARGLIVSIARKEAEKVFTHMEERFHQEFLRVFKRGGWKGKEGIKCIAIQARVMSLKLLEAMVAVRLEDYKDDVGNILSASCLAADGDISGIPDSSTWIGIPALVTIITPSHCRSLLRPFWLTSKELVDSILVKHDANEKEGHTTAEIVTIGLVSSLAIAGVTAVALVGAPVTRPTLAMFSILSALASKIRER
ncbi:hypothetical protein Droror1_Dr00009839 [Drosera rotundifolia]